jgi:small membrane protein
MFTAQIFLVSLIVLALSFVIIKYRERRIGGFVFVAWLLLWTGAAIAVVVPRTTIIVAQALGIGRGVDLVLYVSIIVILYLLFRLFVRMEQMERDLTKLVRTIALRPEDLPPKSTGEARLRSDTEGDA